MNLSPIVPLLCCQTTVITKFARAEGVEMLLLSQNNMLVQQICTWFVFILFFSAHPSVVLPVSCLLSWLSLTQWISFDTLLLSSQAVWSQTPHQHANTYPVETAALYLLPKGTCSFGPESFLKCHCQCFCSGRLYSNLLKDFLEDGSSTFVKERIIH